MWRRCSASARLRSMKRAGRDECGWSPGRHSYGYSGIRPDARTNADMRFPPMGNRQPTASNFGQKKARSNRFGLNPPKKEGGGDSVRLRQTGKLVNQPYRAEHCWRSWTEPAAHRVTVEATFDERIIGTVFVRRKISVRERTEMLHNCLPVENPIRIIDLAIKTAT